MGKTSGNHGRKGSKSKSQKNPIVHRTIKKSRKNSTKSNTTKSTALKTGLPEIPRREIGDGDAGSLPLSLAIAFAMVKIVSIFSKQIEIVHRAAAPVGPRLSNTNENPDDDEDEDEDDDDPDDEDRPKPKSKFDQMKYRAPSPPKRSTNRNRSRSSSSGSSDRRRRTDSRDRRRRTDSADRRRRNDTRDRRRRTGSKSRRNSEHRRRTRSRSRRSVTSSGGGRSRRIAVRYTARKRTGKLGCGRSPLRGILKIRRGKYPEPRPSCQARSKKRIRFRRTVEVRYYYCDLTKAKRNKRNGRA